MRHLPLVVTFVLLSLTPAGLRAQDSLAARRDSACRALGEARRYPMESSSNCHILALQSITAWRDAARRAQREEVADFLPEESQNRASGDASASGLATQGEAVGSTQPTAVAAASLAAANAGDASAAIAAITLNPFTLLGKKLDSTSTFTRSRRADLTVLVPVGATEGNPGEALKYFGLRLRYNFVDRNTKKLLDSAFAAFQEAVSDKAIQVGALLSLFNETTDVTACLEAYEADASDETSIIAACGRFVDVLPDEGAAEELRKRVAAIRDTVDATFWGAELRVDRGDPTFGALPGFSGTYVFLGGAVGIRLPVGTDRSYSVSLRARAGVQYVEVDSGAYVNSPVQDRPLEAAAAVEITRPMAFRPLKLIAGFEYRGGKEAPVGLDEAFRTKQNQIRASLELPVSEAHSLTISYASPGSGETKSSLSVNLNWQMLLKDLAGLR